MAVPRYPSGAAAASRAGAGTLRFYTAVCRKLGQGGGLGEPQLHQRVCASSRKMKTTRRNKNTGRDMPGERGQGRLGALHSKAVLHYYYYLVLRLSNIRVRPGIELKSYQESAVINGKTVMTELCRINQGKHPEEMELLICIYQLTSRTAALLLPAVFLHTYQRNAPGIGVSPCIMK